MKKAFLSYSQADAQQAEELARQLMRAGIDVWLYGWEMRVGDSIAKRINEALSALDTLIVLLSPDSIASEWVDREVGAALMCDKRILPVVLPATKDEDIPPLLRGRVYADLRKRDPDELRKLVEALSPGLQLLRRALDPFECGRTVVLIGTSTRSYQQGERWSVAPAGSIRGMFAVYQGLMRVLDQSRKTLWNYPDAMPPDRLEKGDNVITIGSPKVNRFSGALLAQCSRSSLNNVWFVGREEWREIGAYYALKGLKQVYRPSIDRPAGQGTGLDYGLVVWAPKLDPHLGLSLITGGCHTGASHAAAECSMDPEFYRTLTQDERIRHCLETGDRGFWAIIEVSCWGFAPRTDSLRIVESGVLDDRPASRSRELNMNWNEIWDDAGLPRRVKDTKSSVQTEEWSPRPEDLAVEYGTNPADAYQLWLLEQKGEAP